MNLISFTAEQVRASQEVIRTAADLCLGYEEQRFLDLELLDDLVEALRQLKQVHEELVPSLPVGEEG